MFEKAKVVKEGEERTKIPKLSVNQTNQERVEWKSNWNKYKRDTSLTNQGVSVYILWDCFNSGCGPSTTNWTRTWTLMKTRNGSSRGL